jgi:hypothetical protein
VRQGRLLSGFVAARDAMVNPLRRWTVRAGVRLGRLRFAAVRWTLPRLLLVLVAFGVLGMHTTGHAASIPEHGTCSEHAVAAPVAASVDCHCADPCPGSSDACLAVLTSMGLLLLLIVSLLVAVRRAAVPALGRQTAVAVERGPPLAWPIGLVLTDLAVLRT